MVHPDSRPGNFKLRDLNLPPTGEKQRTTCRLLRTRVRKKSYRFSLVGGTLGNSRFIGPMSSFVISSISSLANRLLTSPVDSTLFMNSRKPSSLISLSVNKNVTPLPCTPDVLYSCFRSSIKFWLLYVRVRMIWKVW
jgi:hypothetical protein